MQMSTLKLTVRSFYSAQKNRKQAGNRVYSLKRELVMPFLDDKANKEIVEAKFKELRDTLPQDQVIEVDRIHNRVFKVFYNAEKLLYEDIKEDIEERSIYKEWIKYVYNIDVILCAATISEIYDVGRFKTISKLWQYSGYGVMKVVKENGITKLWYPTRDDAFKWVDHATNLEKSTADKWKREYDKESKMSQYMQRCVWGLKYDYEEIASKRLEGLPYLCNGKLKEAFWKCSQQFQKTTPDKSKYRKYYDEKKAYYAEKYPDKSKGKINGMTLRKVAKLYASHLWIQWRKLEGLPISKPYAIEKLGHDGYIPPVYDSEPE